MKKPVLECVTETVHKVQWHKLEDFIEKVTGHTYETVANEEWGNDSQHRFSVDGKLNEWESKDWSTFKETGDVDNYRLDTILNGLVHDGYLTAGVYLVTVCW